jgi:prepilin peptidase CpaA
MEWIDMLLLFILAVCLVTDIKERKIYNKVTFPGLGIALFWHSAAGGWHGFWFSFLGFLVGFSILLVPYLLGGMGAGDVKLMAVIGAMKGAAFALATAVYMGLLGGVLALGFLLWRKGIWSDVKYAFYWMGSLQCGLKLPVCINKQHFKKTYPYGVAIVGGALLTLIAKGRVLV